MIPNPWHGNCEWCRFKAETYLGALSVSSIEDITKSFAAATMVPARATPPGTGQLRRHIRTQSPNYPPQALTSCLFDDKETCKNTDVGAFCFLCHLLSQLCEILFRACVHAKKVCIFNPIFLQSLRTQGGTCRETPAPVLRWRIPRYRLCIRYWHSLSSCTHRKCVKSQTAKGSQRQDCYSMSRWFMLMPNVHLKCTNICIAARAPSSSERMNAGVNTRREYQYWYCTDLYSWTTWGKLLNTAKVNQHEL